MQSGKCQTCKKSGALPVAPWCSVVCRRLSVKGFYVYTLHGEDWLPYYVGKGSGDRAWVKHGKRKPLLVKIVKDGLTEQEALALETDTIRRFKSLGAKLTNILKVNTLPGNGPSFA